MWQDEDTRENHSKNHEDTVLAIAFDPHRTADAVPTVAQLIPISTVATPVPAAAISQ